MSSTKDLDPIGERAAATEAMETTPITGKEHEYRADGDHHPRQDAVTAEGDTDNGRAAANHDAAPPAEVQAERHISKGIPGAGEPPKSDAQGAERNHGPGG